MALYVPASNEERDADRLLALMERHPFATLGRRGAIAALEAQGTELDGALAAMMRESLP